MSGRARETLIKIPASAKEVLGLELFATVAAAVSLGDQMDAKQIKMFLGKNASAGSLVKASPTAPLVVALIASSWRTMARAVATSWVERVPAAANPAGATVAPDSPATWSRSCGDGGQFLSDAGSFFCFRGRKGIVKVAVTRVETKKRML